ncbi:uncharacterized protein LOC141705239 [Apium graveolens]|uniref:uncharacterized protein LOC141705239 n=1 Tax=Apium graveolens TaxID=4045 RepID=UPI003D78D8C0
MNIAAWNVRGINKAPHQKELQSFISVNNVHFMGILETKVKSDKAPIISKKVKKEWKWLFNYTHHYNGRVWVGWNPEFWDISLHSMTSQVITCNAVFLEKNLTFLVSFIYAHNDAVDRAPLWDYCLNLSSTSSPWCLLGDFNCVTNLSEISGGREHFTPDMQAFQDCLANCGLDRVRTVGDIFTWSNKRLLNPVFKSLDRMVANGAWFNLFTEGNVFIKPRSIMDHNALLFVEPMQLHRFGKPFQFFNFLIEVPGFFEVVDKAWSKPCTGNSYARFACKLKELKVLLRQFNKDHGNVSSNVSTARANLEEFQLNMLNTEDASLLSVENNLIRNLNLALAEEESLFLQKSRVKWMGLGDGNNSFFHQQCKAHWNRNKILVLQDESGTMVHGQQLCADVAVQYFQQLLGPQVVHSTIDLEAVDCTVISEAQATALSASVNDDLIYSTLKKMKKNKSPGPDGVNAEFFLATWCTTGKDFCDSIRSFFDTGFLPSGVNSTLISLIPKVSSPTKMADFRPISLCTVMYKCISKILASRLKLIMPSVIDIAQSAFIPGRSISDNILLAQELFRGYERETGTAKCALKIDLHKAFDSIHWDFILAVLIRFRFPGIVVKWLKACLFTTKFSVKLNGIIHGYFKGTQGIRQGDPLSPYVFALCMQILSSLLNKVPPEFHYHWRCKEMGLTHLFFADDVLFFSHGSQESVMHILNSINKFSTWSGLTPSINKSNSYLCNCDSNFTNWFDTLLIPRGTFPVRFLGVPLITTQLCVNDCMPLINRITSKLNSWTSLLLSLAGRTLLIKSVILSLEAFWCNHFILPTTVHANIQSLLTRFLWRGNINQKGGAKLSWQTVSLPREEGGLGLKNMCEWNKSQIIGHLLKVVMKSNTLWASWVNKTVLKGKHFWVTKIPTDCSWIWRKVLKLRPLAMNFLSYKIGNGESISIWFDPWWHHSCLASSVSSPIISQSGLHHRDTLDALIHNGAWALPTANSRSHHLDPLLLFWLENFDYPALHLGPDLLLWNGMDVKKIKTWHIWDSIRFRAGRVPWYQGVWHKLRVNRYAHHQWIACHGRLHTLARLHRFGLVETQQCFLCICGRETESHIFLHCSYSNWVLRSLLSSFDIAIQGESWNDFINFLIQLQDTTKSILALCVAQIFCYHIWRERNARAHGMGIFGPKKLLQGIKKDFVARLVSSTWFSKIIDSRPDLVHCTRL